MIGLATGCVSRAGISPEPLPAGSRWAAQGRRLVLVDRQRGLAIAEPGQLPSYLREPLMGALGGAANASDWNLLSPLDSDHPALALFQVGAWRLAEAWFNGALDDGAYAIQFERLVKQCVRLLEEASSGAQLGGTQDCTRPPCPKQSPRAGLQWTDRGYIL